MSATIIYQPKVDADVHVLFLSSSVCASYVAGGTQHVPYVSCWCVTGLLHLRVGGAGVGNPRHAKRLSVFLCAPARISERGSQEKIGWSTTLNMPHRSAFVHVDGNPLLALRFTDGDVWIRSQASPKSVNY